MARARSSGRSTTTRYTVSPCAYVVGLLDQRVDRRARRSSRHGYKVFVADPNLWCPFEDGTYLRAVGSTTTRTVASMRENGFSDADIKGMFAYEDMFDRLRRALREGRARHAGSATRPTATRSRSCSVTIPS